MLALAIGFFLAPTSLLALWHAARVLGSLALGPSSATPFIVGIVVMTLLWAFGRYAAVGRGGLAGRLAAVSKRIYVFGHELTHALAAWSVGVKVYDFHVGKEGGHVDLSGSSAFIALAPYCVPIYTLAVVAGYRLLLWLKPGVMGETVFLALLGASLAFHATLTSECVWDRDQPDLAEAGGVVFSLAIIILVNALFTLILLKTLFPREVELEAVLRAVLISSGRFWQSVIGFCIRALHRK